MFSLTSLMIFDLPIHLQYFPGADPELLLGGGANPGGGGDLPNILIIFSEKIYKIKEILVCSWAAGVPPLDPPLLSK